MESIRHSSLQSGKEKRDDISGSEIASILEVAWFFVFKVKNKIEASGKDLSTVAK